MVTSTPTMNKMVEILLVEDNPLDVFFIQETLKRCRYSVNLGVTHNGVEALAYLRRQGSYSNAYEPELVLLDLNLPKMNGWDVLMEIKADPRLSHIPILIVTSSKSELDTLSAYRLNADVYIVKPMDMTRFPMLLISIERLLGNRLL